MNDSYGVREIVAYEYFVIYEYSIHIDIYSCELENIEAYTIKVIYNQEFTLPTPSRTGYTFTGWEYNGELFEEGIYTYSYDINIRATWEANKYNINYYDGETLIASEEVTYDSSYTLMSSFTKEELTLQL